MANLWLSYVSLKGHLRNFTRYVEGAPGRAVSMLHSCNDVSNLKTYPSNLTSVAFQSIKLFFSQSTFFFSFEKLSADLSLEPNETLHKMFSFDKNSKLVLAEFRNMQNMYYLVI